MFIITHGEIYNNIYLYATSMRVQVWSKISPTGTGADIDKKDLGPIPEDGGPEKDSGSFHVVRSKMVSFENIYTKPQLR